MVNVRGTDEGHRGATTSEKPSNKPLVSSNHTRGSKRHLLEPAFLVAARKSPPEVESRNAGSANIPYPRHRRRKDGNGTPQIRDR